MFNKCKKLKNVLFTACIKTNVAKIHIINNDIFAVVNLTLNTCRLRTDKKYL